MKTWILLVFIMLNITVISGINAQELTLAKLQQEIQQIISDVTPSLVQVYCDQAGVEPESVEKKVHRMFRIIKREGTAEVMIRKLIPGEHSSLEDAGLGIVWDKDGHILTGDFVRNAHTIQVKMADGKSVPAQLKGVDPDTHIALLKIDCENLHPVRLGDSERAQTGSFILSFGNPYGIDGNVSLGIVSSKIRDVKGQPRLPLSIPVYPGDKGGAVFSIHGELIGLVDGVIRPPMNIAFHDKAPFPFAGLPLKKWQKFGKGFAEKLGKLKERTKGIVDKVPDMERLQEWLGDMCEDLEAEIEIECDKQDAPDRPPHHVKKHEGRAPEEENPEVEDAREGDGEDAPDCPPPHVKKHEGRAPDEEKVMGRQESPNPFWMALPPHMAPETGPSMAVPVHILRPIVDALKNQGKVERGWLGVMVTPIAPAVRAQLPQLGEQCALQVEDVAPNSPAQEAGLQKWDIITKFNQQPFATIENFRRAVEKTLGAVPVEIIRNAKTTTLTVTIKPKTTKVTVTIKEKK